MSSLNELRYTKEHEWVRVEGDKAIVGITDFAQSQLGDIVFVELPELGKNVTVGGGVSVIESVKAVSDVYSPVSGTVVEVNEALADTPELVNQDPYGEGWIVVIALNDKAELDNLLDLEAYEKLVSEGGH